MTIATAADCRTMTAAEILSALCPAGNPIAGVDVEQDWDREETTIRFRDGSSLVVSGPRVQIEAGSNDE